MIHNMGILIAKLKGQMKDHSGHGQDKRDWQVADLELARANGDLVEILQEVPSNGLHLFGPGCTPQQSLPVRPDLQHDHSLQAP